MDRRLIRDRVSRLGDELETIEQNRSTNRTKRMKSGIPVAAIVGYTNAGKSTLLNRLTGADGRRGRVFESRHLDKNRDSQIGNPCFLL